VIGSPLDVGLVAPSNISPLSALGHKSHPVDIIEPVVARDTVDLDQRASFSSFGKILGDLAQNDLVQNIGSSIASGVASTVAGDLANKVLNNTRRERC
jgi:hypothetical protein